MACYDLGMLICFANTKGGVGKSTLSAHLAVWLFDRGYRVGLLDCDQQRSSSTWVQEAEEGVEVVTANNPEEVASAAQALRGRSDIVVADSPGGLDDRCRTLLLVADLAVFPITPSILDLRSVTEAAAILRYAQTINGGRPSGRLLLNQIKTRGIISRQLIAEAPALGLTVAQAVVRDFEAFRDAAQQGTVVTRMRQKAARGAAADLDALFGELLAPLDGIKQVSNV